MNKEINENTPWYKQWMVWMVITPPVTAVIAGIITINLAISSDDGLVVDDYYKQGLGINQTLQRDQLARDMNLDAELSIESNTIKVQFVSNMNDPALSLSFIHPTQSQRDIIVLLVRSAEGLYQSDIPDVPKGNRNLLLEPSDKSWRISGRINLSEEKLAVLQPNLK
ncbi:MAG: FixH family protein [Gammaproteobacteria bacterium]|nr:FixH family protein [Gammaproteobacteria bacterium]